jgi:hypothetical protein
LLGLGCFDFSSDKVESFVDILHEFVFWHDLTHFTQSNEALASILVNILILLCGGHQEVKDIINGFLQL